MSKVHRCLAKLFIVGLSFMLPAAFAATLTPTQLTKALHWRSVGPYVGGVVIAVTGVTDKPNLYYMGSTGGGVWKSDDYGQDWKNISDKYFDNNNIGAIAVAPSNPKVIYVGTGNPDIRNTLLTGDGMYKSTDGGETWSKDGLARTHIISRIVVDPDNADVVYAAAMGHVWAPNPERGIFKSTDGGKTWKKVLYVNAKTGAIDLVMDPKNPEVLYAAMWQAWRRHWTFSSGGPGSGIFKTTNGGATWTNITHNEGLPQGIFGRIGLAIAPSKPDVVYTIVQAKYKGQAGGLFRSADAGQSWKLVNNSMNITQRAFYYSRVYVSPRDPDTIYLPQVAALWVSHDGGKTLAKLKTPHGDNHSMWVNPKHPRLMIEGNDGGATVSLNGGKSWSTVHNQPTGQFYHVNLDDQFPFHIYGAQQDEGSAEGPSAVRYGAIPPVWTPVMGGEESWVVPQPGKPWITYGIGYYSKYYRGNRRTGVVRSISPWPTFKFGSAASRVKYRFGWNHHPNVIVPGHPDRLLFGANVLFESTDHGLHWTIISPDLTRDDKSKQQRPGGPISADVTGEETFDTISSIGVSPLDAKVIWTGSDDGLVYVTRDAGGRWSQVRPAGMPKWSTVTSIQPSFAHAGTAYLTASRFDWDDFAPYVYKTTDYGQHWTKITAGVPDDQYTESVREDPDAPNLLFLGTSKSVYMSLDGGADWLPLRLNLPPVRVNSIAIQPAQHAVVLATFGRAFWVLDNLQFLEQLSHAHVAANAPCLFKPQQTWLVTRHVSREAHHGKNLHPGATVFFHVPANYDGHTPVTLTFTDAHGNTIRSFKLHLKHKHRHGKKENKAQLTLAQKRARARQKHTAISAGMNRFRWDLRYPEAVDVKGIYDSGQGAGRPIGPEVVPGRYYARLSYGSTTVEQPFVIKLDPRLDTTQAQLQQRFDLLMQIHKTINSLDVALNDALDARAQLNKAVAARQISAASAKQALANLDRDIDALVDFRIQSGEGSLVYPARLRAWLSWLAQDISVGLVPPTSAQQQVAGMYIHQADAGESRLKSDTAAADAVLGVHKG